MNYRVQGVKQPNSALASALDSIATLDGGAVATGINEPYGEFSDGLRMGR